MWTYEQATGIMLHDAEEVGTGYSGHGIGLNNPKIQNVRGVGPIPQGRYTIQPPSEHPQLGPIALALLPDLTNKMFLRDGFFCHGDNAEQNHTASEGCIIMPRTVRVAMAGSDNQLEVI
jgi:hypothetical protein